MTRIAILPFCSEEGSVSYFAIAGARQARGRTAGEALDALTAQLPSNESTTLVIVQNRQPDEYFTETQQQRLAELMERWKDFQLRGTALPSDEQAELDSLVDAEVRASAARTSELADSLGL